MTEFKYPNEPIYKIESLAKHLGSTSAKLKKLAENSHEYYRPKTKPKKNGGVRRYYSIREPLKSILRKIRERILIKVTYPGYLQGSVKGRSPKTNAQIHIGANCLMELDIADFFPSINSDQVNSIFRYFFNFSEDVSRLLTELISHQGRVPQGSPVSSDIANLAVSWDGDEAILVEQLKNKGLRYSRYVDDIAISSTRSLTNSEKTEAIKMVNFFITGKGFKVSHKKTCIAGPTKVKNVTGLRIGKNRVNIRPDYADSVYREIKQVENEETSNANKATSLRGKINHIKQFNPKQAGRLEKLSLHTFFSESQFSFRNQKQ